MRFRRPCHVRFDLVVYLTAWPSRMRKKTNQPDDNTAFITHVILLVLYTHYTAQGYNRPMLRNLYKISCRSFVRVSKKWKQSYGDLSIYIVYVRIYTSKSVPFSETASRKCETAAFDCSNDAVPWRTPPAPILHHFDYVYTS